MEQPTLQQVIAYAKSYGFLYPSSEIYEGLQAVYDYGPYGIMLKRNLQDFWWQSMTQVHDNIVGLDAAILMDPRTWQASGHVAGFNDWMVDNKDSQKRYRVDVLLEDQAAIWEKEGKKDKAKKLMEAMDSFMKERDGASLTQLLIQANVQCPVAHTSAWTEAKKFNLMFATTIGASQQAATKVYLRPETAQGIFVNFLNVQKTARMKVPFGIAQIGKAFRNEIVARQFIFRMREFEQMEMQFFVPPKESDQWFTYWKAARKQWYQALGIHEGQLKLHPHEQLAHYATAAVDLMYDFPFGYKEVEGVHARADFDLRNHEKEARKKLHYFDPLTNTSYLPYVIETSAGCDRLILMLLCKGLKHTAADAARTYLQLPPQLAPIKAAILPLVKKDGLAEYAKNIFQDLKYDFPLAYEVGGSIGKRYVRQDLIGTPYCFTIDHQTLQDETVTVRERDTMQQERMPVKAISDFLQARVSIKTLLTKLTP